MKYHHFQTDKNGYRPPRTYKLPLYVRFAVAGVALLLFALLSQSPLAGWLGQGLFLLLFGLPLGAWLLCDLLYDVVYLEARCAQTMTRAEVDAWWQAQTEEFRRWWAKK